MTTQRKPEKTTKPYEHIRKRIAEIMEFLSPLILDVANFGRGYENALNALSWTDKDIIRPLEEILYKEKEPNEIIRRRCDNVTTLTIEANKALTGSTGKFDRRFEPVPHLRNLIDELEALSEALAREQNKPAIGGKADLPSEKPAERKQDAKRIIAAILISLIMILLVELFVHFGPVTWFRNHPHSYGIQGSIICLIPCLIFGVFKPGWRKWCWGTVAIAFLVGLVSLL